MSRCLPIILNYYMIGLIFITQYVQNERIIVNRFKNRISLIN